MENEQLIDAISKIVGSGNHISFYPSYDKRAVYYEITNGKKAGTPEFISYGVRFDLNEITKHVFDMGIVNKHVIKHTQKNGKRNTL